MKEKIIQKEKYYLYRNILIKIFYTLFIFILLILLFEKHIKQLDISQQMFLGGIIYLCSIIIICSFLKRLKIIVTYSKKQIYEIEQRVKKLDKDNWYGDIYLFDEYLMYYKKDYFKIIKYDEINWILKEEFYSRYTGEFDDSNSWLHSGNYKNYGETMCVTKDKKVYKIGYIKRAPEFKENLLAKNPQILFGNSKKTIKQAKEIYGLNNNYIQLFKKHILQYYIGVLLLIFYTIIYMI